MLRTVKNQMENQTKAGLVWGLIGIVREAPQPFGGGFRKCYIIVFNVVRVQAST